MLSFDLAGISKRCFGGLSGCLLFCKSQATALKATLYACIGLYSLQLLHSSRVLRDSSACTSRSDPLANDCAFSKRLIPAVSIVMGLKL